VVLAKDLPHHVSDPTHLVLAVNHITKHETELSKMKEKMKYLEEENKILHNLILSKESSLRNEIKNLNLKTTKMRKRIEYFEALK